MEIPEFGADYDPDEVVAMAHGSKKAVQVWPRLLGIGTILAALLLTTTFVARPSRVLGSSMLESCRDGDFVLLWQLNYHPHHGDIVVVNDNNLLQTNLIKRVIALGGDHLQVSDGIVLLNGRRLQESYVKDAVWSGVDVDVTVPHGQVFLMGDNRSHSTDSREIGSLPTSDVIGKVVLRFFPLNTWRFY